MAIITNITSKGTTNTSTLNGSIILDEGAGELRVYKTIGNDRVVVNKFDADGIHNYDTNGNKISELTTSGFDFYDENGTKRATISKSSSGNVRLLIYDADGKGVVLVGQAPNTQPTLASVFSGYDVETELAPVSLMSAPLVQPSNNQGEE